MKDIRQVKERKTRQILPRPHCTSYTSSDGGCHKDDDGYIERNASAVTSKSHGRHISLGTNRKEEPCSLESLIIPTSFIMYMTDPRNAPCIVMCFSPTLHGGCISVGRQHCASHLNRVSPARTIHGIFWLHGLSGDEHLLIHQRMRSAMLPAFPFGLLKREDPG
ncbi:uncharacterized protein K489DRAFT_234760 [Dissoconium aciculare CBS 342.82]|uniref:Uncharacterized protein n=1 Tax=Dissoconium aciculare CBS 342.82 TaxID=1314786 RepID=A0A6J3M3V8_9PEZI|nr:uncharacterized protein K489DRAFT_234760 [Dissoconium aciculare CBS 342.82]KAF1822164.1 hypothetical protein K489DRAFT_234760 [Dissoconium aciculare CBS 342.82]